MAVDELGSRALSRCQIFWVTTQLNNCFGNLAQFKNRSALLIRFLKNVWKQKVVFAKLKCVPKVTFQTSWAEKTKQEGCNYIFIYIYKYKHIFKEKDGPKPLFFVVSHGCDLYMGHTRATLVSPLSSTTSHYIIATWRHCSNWFVLSDREIALKKAPEIHGWAGLSVRQVDDFLLKRHKRFPVNKAHGFQKRLKKNIFGLTIPFSTVCLLCHFGELISGYGRKIELRFENLRKKPVPVSQNCM